MRYRTCELNSLKKLGFEGEIKAPTPPLNSFSNVFFFRKIAIFVTFKENCLIRFSKLFEKRKYRESEVRKTLNLVSPYFLYPNFKQSFLYVSVHVMLRHSVVSNAYQ